MIDQGRKILGATVCIYSVCLLIVFASPESWMGDIAAGTMFGWGVCLIFMRVSGVFKL